MCSPEWLHVLSPAEDLSLAAESDPVQGKDTVWVGQNSGNKFWSLLPVGSREAVLVWLSCLGDAPALSQQPHTATLSLPAQALAGLALRISCRILMLLAMYYTH